MEMIELASCDDALTTEIRERAKNGSACSLTKKYSVRENATEVAYAAIDWYDLRLCSDLILYEMFVPKKFRHSGVGSRILEKVEGLAKANGYSRVIVIARPLEDYPKEKLKAWYQQRGYEIVPHESHASEDAMAKVVE
ncbi:MAG TPA: GNAT family N-acetyltransferase [Terriglobales bacterium]|nr:GNAT family N-acetyltransferase [Terriglobales bacterium]